MFIVCTFLPEQIPCLCKLSWWINPFRILNESCSFSPHVWPVCSRTYLGLGCPLLYLVFFGAAVRAVWNELSVYKLQERDNTHGWLPHLGRLCVWRSRRPSLNGWKCQQSHLCDLHLYGLCVFFSHCSFWETIHNTIQWVTQQHDIPWLWLASRLHGCDGRYDDGYRVLQAGLLPPTLRAPQPALPPPRLPPPLPPRTVRSDAAVLGRSSHSAEPCPGSPSETGRASCRERG